MYKNNGFIPLVILVIGAILLGAVSYTQFIRKNNTQETTVSITPQEGLDIHLPPSPTPAESEKPNSSSTPKASPSPTPSSHAPLRTTSPKPSPRVTPSPTTTATPSPTITPDIPGKVTVGNCQVTQRSNYLVKPYLVYPTDKPMYPEYESSIKDYLTELQNWYCNVVGQTFNMTSLQVVRSTYNYQTIRCGPNPTQECLNNPAKLDGNIGMYMNIAIHGREVWESQTAALIFSAGAGGYAGANKYPNDTGFAIVGDWAIEPISGRANDWGIPCRYSDGWQCAGGVPKGTPAHELGHAFGLPHPGRRPTIMEWHGDYPWAGLLPQEVDQLKQSSFFQ